MRVLQHEDAGHVDRDFVGAVDARPWLTPFLRWLAERRRRQGGATHARLTVLAQDQLAW